MGSLDLIQTEKARTKADCKALSSKGVWLMESVRTPNSEGGGLGLEHDG